MYHGLLYDRAGHVVEIPGQESISTRLKLRTYPVLERYNWIWIWMGNCPGATELLPPLMGMDNSAYVFGCGQLDYAAEARLINENLLNLGHASFLHTETFRVSETWARQHPRVTPHERSIRSERWLANQGKSCMDDANRVDIYFCQEFFAPNALLMIDRRFPLGTAEMLKGKPPPLELADETYVFSSQVVTPLTEKTARYFYIFGARPAANETAFDTATAEKAFLEDKTMIEAQQRNIDSAPERRFVSNTGDRAVALFDRLIERLARDEAAQSSGDSLPGAETRATEFESEK
jgi:vanillate O-demethylase monooxygenase subunit